MQVSLFASRLCSGPGLDPGPAPAVCAGVGLEPRCESATTGDVGRLADWLSLTRMRSESAMIGASQADEAGGSAGLTEPLTRHWRRTTPH